jgi:hypothetical protein
MEQHIGTLQTAATNFVRKLKPNDIAQVVDFDSRVEIRQGFTGNQADLQTAIEQTNAGGSTSLHNAIYIALKELRKVKAVNEEDVRGRPIVFSDGGDVEPRELRGSDGVGRIETTSRLPHADPTYIKGFREAEHILRQFARNGGRAFFVQRRRADPGASDCRRLSSQLVGYASRTVATVGAGWRCR